jgi:FkbM family methyltransferase
MARLIAVTTRIFMNKILYESKQEYTFLNLVKDFILGVQENETGKKKLSKIKNNPFILFKDDYISHQIITQGLYERYELNTFFSYFKQNKKIKYKNKICLDVGASLGNHAIFFSKIFKKVITFEPNPKVFTLLKYNTSFYKNIKNLNFGLFDKNKLLNLKIYTYNSGGSTLKYNIYNNNNTVKVKVKTLDSLNIKERIGLIKIDTENSEFEVLKGSQKTIKKNKPIILFEQQSSQIKNFTSKSISLLRKNDYSFFNFYIPQLNGFFLTRMFKKIISIFFGHKISMIKLNDKIKKKNYNMIVAIQNDLL